MPGARLAVCVGVIVMCQSNSWLALNVNWSLPLPVLSTTLRKSTDLPGWIGLDWLGVKLTRANCRMVVVSTISCGGPDVAVERARTNSMCTIPAGADVGITSVAVIVALAPGASERLGGATDAFQPRADSAVIAKLSFWSPVFVTVCTQVTIAPGSADPLHGGAIVTS